MRKILAIFVIFLLSAATAGWAYTDFYGIKMRSVSNAKDLVIEQTPDNSLKVTQNENTMDDRIRAWGQLKHAGTGRYGGVKITVENGSDKPIPTDLTFIDFTLIMANGDEHGLEKPAAFGLPEEIAPGKKATFVPSFGGLRVKKADIRMIVCSFDMGETKVVLVPWPYTKPVKKPAKPAKPAEPVVKKEAEKLIQEPVEPKKSVEPQKTAVAAKKEAPARVEDREKPNPNNFALPRKDRRKKYVR